MELGGKVEVSAVTGLSLHTRWVGQFWHLVEVTPEEDEAGAYTEEHQSSPEADVVKGLPHAHPVGQLLGKGQAQAESVKPAGTWGTPPASDSCPTSLVASWSLVLSATKFTASTQLRTSGAAAPKLWQRAAVGRQP